MKNPPALLLLPAAGLAVPGVKIGAKPIGLHPRDAGDGINMLRRNARPVGDRLRANAARFRYCFGGAAQLKGFG